MSADILLSVNNINASYSKKIKALKNVSLDVSQGSIVALIGCNGAGKTTLLKVISALLPCDQGNIFFDGREITKMPAHQIARLGLAHVPEGRRIFARLSVAENLHMGHIHRRDAGGIERDLRQIFELFPILKKRQDQLGGTLSGGEQQMLAIARALMMSPKLLLLDEPSMGLAPVITDKIFEVITEINRQGRTVLLVEQNASRALEIAHHAYIIDQGSITAQDQAQNLLKNPKVQETYLGIA